MRRNAKKHIGVKSINTKNLDLPPPRRVPLNFNFEPLQIASRYRNPQLQVAEHDLNYFF